LVGVTKDELKQMKKDKRGASSSTNIIRLKCRLQFKLVGTILVFPLRNEKRKLQRSALATFLLPALSETSHVILPTGYRWKGSEDLALLVCDAKLTKLFLIISRRFL